MIKTVSKGTFSSALLETLNKLEPISLDRPWGTILRLVLNEELAVTNTKVILRAIESLNYCKSQAFQSGLPSSVMNRLWSAHVLDLLPDQRLSLHAHKLRDEFFLNIKGDTVIQVGDETWTSVAGEWYFVPSGSYHRVAAGVEGGSVLEIAFGFYDQINDITRLTDDYGRVDLDGSV